MFASEAYHVECGVLDASFEDVVGCFRGSRCLDTYGNR